MVKVHHHASVVVIESEFGGRFLFGGYDKGYPVEVFRDAVNLIGGNHESLDVGPKDILLREIGEEFSVPDGKEDRFAPSELLDNIRQEIVGNLIAVGDYLVTDPPVRPERKINEVIFSFYGARVKDLLMDEAKKYLDAGKRLTTEGFVRVLSKEDITFTVNYARNGVMPYWNKRLDDDTIRQLAIYVHSLGGGE